MKKALISFLILGVMVFSLGYAQTTTTSTSTSTSTNEQLVQKLKALIEQLKVQLADLQAKVQALVQARQKIRTEGVTTSSVQNLIQSREEFREKVGETKDVLRDIADLKRGMTSEEIKAVQQILAEDSSIYPEGIVSGYFGPATERALNKFREKYGILDEKGEKLGEKTLKKLQELLQEGRVIKLENGKKCVIVPPGKLVAPGRLKKSTSTLQIPECQVLPVGIQRLLKLGLPPKQTSTLPVVSPSSTATSTGTSTATSTEQ